VIDLNGINVNRDIHPNGKEFLYIELAEAGGARLVRIPDRPELVRQMAAGAR